MNQVVLTVLSAKDLPRADGLKGRSDPYCLCFWNGVKVFHTNTVMNNCDPNWNEGNQVSAVFIVLL